jgi:hypothetical protein
MTWAMAGGGRRQRNSGLGRGSETASQVQLERQAFVSYPRVLL